jgi:hypothetical protein
MAERDDSKRRRARGQAPAAARAEGPAPTAAWRELPGRRLLALSNGRYTVELWPAKGGALVSYRDEDSGIDALWKNAMGGAPRLEPTGQPQGPGTDLFDVMDGSWYVSLPNGFFPADYLGAPLGTHGELRSVPWEVEGIEREPGLVRVTLVGASVRTPIVYHRQLTLRRGSGRMHWRETLSNRSAEDLPVAWLHHPTFAGPLAEGGRLVVPASSVSVNPAADPSSIQLLAGHAGPWPLVPEGTGGALRDCSLVPAKGSGLDHSVTLSGLGAGWGCLWNDALGLGFGMEWDPGHFPCAWSWARGGGERPRYPLWGEGCLVTLQPSTSPPAPFPELLRRRALLFIPAKGSVTTEMSTGFVRRPDGPWAG